MSQFPRTTQILSGLEGLVGAVAFNFTTHEVLFHVDNGLDLHDAVPFVSASIVRHQNLIVEMGLYDIAEHAIVTTDQHYHVTAIVPQFDTVAVYMIITRYIMLDYVMNKLEDVIYSMR